jgi:hypothetical protein
MDVAVPIVTFRYVAKHYKTRIGWAIVPRPQMASVLFSMSKDTTRIDWTEHGPSYGVQRDNDSTGLLPLLAPIDDGYRQRNRNLGWRSGHL